MKQGIPILSKPIHSLSFILVTFSAVVWTSCVSSELAIPATHPANPQARVPQVRTTEALTTAYALDNAASPPSEGSWPEAHDGHVDGNQQAAPSLQHDHSTTEAQPAASATFTCPMHPEVIRAEPGNCPTCGMKLIPRKAAK